LAQVNRDLLAEMGRRCPEQKIATVDQDSTIIESHKREALPTYQGERGYQPMLAVWAETDLILADQFRDGNVPAMQEPLRVAQAAFAALPATVEEFYYRGDAACHEHHLIAWLRDEQREGGPLGKIGFAISARMSQALRQAVEAVPEAEWQPYGKPDPEVLRECAEVPFVPTEAYERKDTEPLRYVAVRIRKRQGALFADGSAVKHFAVATNLREWSAAKLLEWHRQKAGTIEAVHHVLKNELAAGVLPCGRFGANAAWLRLAVLTHNVLTALKRLALPVAGGATEAIAVSDFSDRRTAGAPCPEGDATAGGGRADCSLARSPTAAPAA
jgi:Transposase DDE domain group 1